MSTIAGGCLYKARIVRLRQKPIRRQRPRQLTRAHSITLRLTSRAMTRARPGPPTGQIYADAGRTSSPAGKRSGGAWRGDGLMRWIVGHAFFDSFCLTQSRMAFHTTDSGKQCASARSMATFSIAVSSCCMIPPAFTRERHCSHNVDS